MRTKEAAQNLRPPQPGGAQFLRALLLDGPKITAFCALARHLRGVESHDLQSRGHAALGLTQTT